MSKIYIVYCTSGDFESSSSKPKSVWKSEKRASKEVEILRNEMELTEKFLKEKENFCSKCPIHNHLLTLTKVEKLAKERCEDFIKDESIIDSEIFCKNEYQQYGFNEWYEFGIWEMEME